MQNKTFWASRDLEASQGIGTNDGLPKSIKIWDVEPKFVRPNNVFVGKVYMGMIAIEDWNGPTIEPGEVKEVTITFNEVEGRASGSTFEGV